MRIEIHSQPFDPWEELRRYEAYLNMQGRFGATTVFVGTLRDFNEGEVQSMTLEHYSGMTERHLEDIVKAAGQRWEVLDVLVIHRVGELNPGDPIVLVAVWSTHRRAAYEANRFILEDLKHQAPFWKKEYSVHGARWVTQNTPG